MGDLIAVLLENSDVIIGAVAGAVATGIVFIVKRTKTDLDDKLVEKVVEKLKK